MKVSLFLGAGASTMFGKPTTAEFLQLLPERLNSKTIQFYNHLADKLRFEDIEDALQALKEVRLFCKNDVGKLVLACTSMPGIQHEDNSFWLTCNALKNQIESTIKSQYGWDHEHDQKLIDIYDQIFNYIRSQTGTATVFTTNYDTAIETYCRRRNYTCVDGFVGTSDLRRWAGDFDTKNANSPVRLYKLHGSLEWKLHKEYGIIMGPELGNSSNIEKDIMIMPTRSPKDEEKETPFSEIYRLMKEEFWRQDACIVIGCSFRDESINDVFRAFIREEKTMVVVSPTVAKDVPDNLLQQECESASGPLGELYISPKIGLGHVVGFADKFGPHNAAELISKSLSTIQERFGQWPYRYRHK